MRFLHLHDTQNNILDIGEANWVSEQIRLWFRPWRLENTLTTDLNWSVCAPSNWYNTIFCFEVIEHLMNPALMLTEVRRVLMPGCALYLSTPLHNRLGFYFNETNHFAEYKESSLRILLDYCGFEVTDVHKFKSIPFWQSFRHGAGLVRGTLRALTQETILIRAVKR